MSIVLWPAENWGDGLNEAQVKFLRASCAFLQARDAGVRGAELQRLEAAAQASQERLLEREKDEITALLLALPD